MEDLFNQFQREVRRQDPDFQYLPPVGGTNARWERVRANDPDVGWDSQKLRQMLRWAKLKGSRAVVVLLDGRILVEWNNVHEESEASMAYHGDSTGMNALPVPNLQMGVVAMLAGKSNRNTLRSSKISYAGVVSDKGRLALDRPLIDSVL